MNVEQTDRMLSASRLQMSVVVPAYNEAARLRCSLDLIHSYCAEQFDGKFEIIVVNDGSSDGTEHCLEKLRQDYVELNVLTHPNNIGKGAAVRTGMLAARGRYQLFTDADCATPISEERVLRQSIDNGADIAMGSRTSGDRSQQCKRATHRAFAAWFFRLLVQQYARTGIHDSQCGFKMFTAKSKELFRYCNETGYLFDVFVTLLARNRGFHIQEVPVQWREMPGSKIRLIRDSYHMLKALKTIKQRVENVEWSVDESQVGPNGPGACQELPLE